MMLAKRMVPVIAFAMLGGAAWAQTPVPASDWPTKTVRIIVPTPPGGPSDMVIRLAAEKMQAGFKQPIVVENRSGANGALGAAEVARAPADGYTWLFGTDTTVTVNPHVYRKLPFKAEDLEAVMVATRFSQTLVCHPSAGVKTLPELLSKIKAEKLNYASGGAGSPGHLATEMLLAATGTDMGHVPYKGPAAAMQDVLAGLVPCGFLAGPTVLPHVRAGKLTALAVSGIAGSAALPEVPTVARAGVPGYDATFTLVLFAPKGTPAAAVQAFTRALAQALRTTDVVDKLRPTDQEVVAASPADSAAAIATAHRKWGEVAQRINLQLD